ncbi:hypothetical protein D3C72_1558470 [compost metagenome]
MGFRRLGIGLTAPQPDDAQALIADAVRGPEIPEALNRLLAELVSLRDPDDEPVGAVGGEGPRDGGLRRHPRLACAGGEADDGASSPVVTGAGEQVVQVRDHLDLVVVEGTGLHRTGNEELRFPATPGGRGEVAREADLGDKGCGGFAAPALRRLQPLGRQSLPDPGFREDRRSQKGEGHLGGAMIVAGQLSPDFSVENLQQRPRAARRP